MNLVLVNPEAFTTLQRLSLETLIASIQAGWDTEHTADGAHGSITGTSVRMQYSRLHSLSFALADQAVAGITAPSVPEPFAWAFIKASDDTAAIYLLRGLGHATAEISDPGAVFSVTAGTGSSYNLYWTSTRNRYELENRSGGTRSFVVTLLIAG
jgi:hypothetical protein